ncbi:transposase [Streptomyces chattanoogensis]|uniref:transposase n=1 Tax=Streptomyces chattanoogensis TaxID=66876 RepID=UPI00369F1F20
MIVFSDESGLSLLPPVRRTWAPAGQTPTLKMRMGQRPKVSVVGWCCYSPGQVARYFYRVVPGSVTDRILIRQLRQVHRSLGRPIVVIWDNLSSHRSRRMHMFAARSHWLTLVYLPPYAPDLNPVEGGWAHIKNGPLANLGARTLSELLTTARRGLRHIQRHPALVTGFLAATRLDWDPQPSTP